MGDTSYFMLNQYDVSSKIDLITNIKIILH